MSPWLGGSQVSGGTLETKVGSRGGAEGGTGSLPPSRREGVTDPSLFRKESPSVLSQLILFGCRYGGEGPRDHTPVSYVHLRTRRVVRGPRSGPGRD